MQPLVVGDIDAGQAVAHLLVDEALHIRADIVATGVFAEERDVLAAYFLHIAFDVAQLRLVLGTSTLQPAAVFDRGIDDKPGIGHQLDHVAALAGGHGLLEFAVPHIPSGQVKNQLDAIAGVFFHNPLVGLDVLVDELPLDVAVPGQHVPPHGALDGAGLRNL